MGWTAGATALMAILASGTQMYTANQATQHAKGAAEAQKTATDAQIAGVAATTAADTKAKTNQGSATQSAALAALRAALSASSGMGGTVLGGGATNAPVAPTATKQLLGA